MSVQKAGAVILSKENPQNVLLLYRSIYRDWSFPKGHVEAGETAEMGAVREIMEETSLEVEIISSLSVFSYANAKDGDIECSMFLVQSRDDLKLCREYEGDDFLWVDYRDVHEKLPYGNLKKWYQKNVDKIKPYADGISRTV